MRKQFQKPSTTLQRTPEGNQNPSSYRAVELCTVAYIKEADLLLGFRRKGGRPAADSLSASRQLLRR
ncbi:hypothetical protein AXF42_Ash001855 [Apostasia shenzhenica]|uniref:Uncharacterized protein n=1 Tax=Apostasia shenzhenica TaxID=1088818 RepID=A0A2I0ABF9_9ASPA|nr:hypothetical protein AXF42_Ash001855 [Apostasia shenzhenica]